MTIHHHSNVGLAAYHDLKRLLLDDAISEVRGSLTLVKAKRGNFWYDKYRVGNTMKQKYIGPDTEEIRSRVSQLHEIKDQKDARQKKRSRLIAELRRLFSLRR